MPLLSVCIPAYNRPEVLPALLDSVLSQDFDDYEVVICEDDSPARNQIRDIAQSYSAARPGRVRYVENDRTLGYDANLRKTIECATGEYCFFMGNDDLMKPGALQTVAAGLRRYAGIGVVLRSYEVFAGSPTNIVRTARYFAEERLFPAGADTIVTFFRRSVVIPGMVLHRGEALKHATDRFDGSTLYQLYLVGSILGRMNGLFLPQFTVLYRDGGVPEFGNAEAEKGRFVPNTHTADSSLYFMRRMLEIARAVEEEQRVPVYDRIRQDISRYSYPILAMHSHRRPKEFLDYSRRLRELGLGASPWFFVYTALLLGLGSSRVDRMIQFVKNRLGHTPAIGRVYKGVRDGDPTS